MKKWWRTSRKPRRPDLDDGDLLAHLDGELPLQRASEVESALNGSWDLRVRRAALERDIEIFVRAESEEVLPPPPEFDRIIAPARRHLANPATGTGRGAPRRPLRLKAVAAAAGFLLLAFVAGLVIRPQHASGAVVLARSVSAEQRHRVNSVPSVSYQRLRLQQRSPRREAPAPLVWEIWRSTHSPLEIREVLAMADGRRLDLSRASIVDLPDSYTNLIQLCQSHGMDPRSPLSAAAYSNWRDRSRAQLNAEEGDEKTIALVATSDSLVSELVLRENDYHAIRQRWTATSGAHREEFEVTEEAFQILARASLPAEFFDAPRPASAALAVPRQMTPPLPPVAVPAGAPDRQFLPADPERSLADAITAEFILHQARVCNDGRVRCLREPQGLIVRGEVPDPASLDSIKKALEEIPALRVSLRISPEQSVAVSPNAESLFAGNPTALEQRDALAVSLASMSEAVAADAEAILHLTATFPQSEYARLGPASRYLLQRLYRDHVTALQKNTAILASLLPPEWTESAPVPGPTDSSTQGRSLADTCRLIQSSMSDLRKGLTGSATGEEISRIQGLGRWLAAVPRHIRLTGEDLLARLEAGR